MIIESLLSRYIEAIAKILRRLRFRPRILGVEIYLEDQKAEKTIDERIAKIDTARNNLKEVIEAIDELKKEAENNKKEVQENLKRIASLEQDKATLNKRIKTMKSVLDSDVETFAEVSGIPTENDIKRERYIGFISGVIASLIASGIFYGVIELVK